MTGFGLSLAASVREPIARVAELVKSGEHAGFEVAYIIDSQLAVKDVYTTLTLCATATSTIALATGVTNPITRDLTVTASAISALQEVSNGRAILGISNGATAVTPIGRKPATIAEMRQSIVTLRALLAGEEVEHNGKNIRMAPPEVAVPIVIAASSPRMLALAGAVADGVIITGTSQPHLLREQVDAVLSGLATSQRPRSEFVIDLWQTISVASERAQALDDVKAWVAGQTLTSWLRNIDNLPADFQAVLRSSDLEAIEGEYAVESHLSLAARHRALISDELADFAAIAGDGDYCVAKLRELAQLDVDRITLPLLSRNREERLRELGTIIETVAR